MSDNVNCKLKIFLNYLTSGINLIWWTQWCYENGAALMISDENSTIILYGYGLLVN